ncbi:hypothetical protein FGO68_gene9872 [Halteria grandinella]|uniref:Uncharacterized protein n=1 Tax=Halteria grandinella TaxID=5974 RepID=A0A8J8T3C5_HALGN|nr:hypothetical protein FGO68_gene9872 [Halteria grandinella]
MQQTAIRIPLSTHSCAVRSTYLVVGQHIHHRFQGLQKGIRILRQRMLIKNPFGLPRAHAIMQYLRYYQSLCLKYVAGTHRVQSV